MYTAITSACPEEAKATPNHRWRRKKLHDVVDCCLFYRAGPRDALRAAGELPTSRKVYSVKDPLTKANWSQISSDRSKFAAPCRYQLPLHIIARKESTSQRKQEITAQSGDLTSCYNRLSIVIHYTDIHCTHQKTIHVRINSRILMHPYKPVLMCGLSMSRSAPCTPAQTPPPIWQ